MSSSSFRDLLDLQRNLRLVLTTPIHLDVRPAMFWASDIRRSRVRFKLEIPGFATWEVDLPIEHDLQHGTVIYDVGVSTRAAHSSRGMVRDRRGRLVVLDGVYALV